MILAIFVSPVLLNQIILRPTNKFVYFQVIAERLSEEEIGGLKQMFKMIDADNSGTITFEELKQGLQRVGSNLMESEIKELMDAVRSFILSFKNKGV